MSNAAAAVKVETMETYIKNFKVFIDTCSLLDPHFEKFMEIAVPYVKKYHNAFIIAASAIYELKKHCDNKNDKELSDRAGRRLNHLLAFKQEGIFAFYGDPKDGNFADNIYLSVFTRHRVNYNMLLITQDNDLAKDILSLNNSRSVNTTKMIAAMRIGSSAMPEDFYWNSARKKAEGSAPIEKFAVTREITQVPDDIINISHIPAEGETVFTSDKQPVRLKEHRGSGGEADICSTGPPYNTKIYKSGQMIHRKKEETWTNSKHPVWSMLMLAGLIIIVAGLIYGFFHPGVIQTLLMQVRRVLKFRSRCQAP